MARALKGKIDREQVLVLAHGSGIARAHEVFAVAIDTALRVYPNDDEAQFAYIAGLAQELRRIVTRTQNKGFRKQEAPVETSAQRKRLWELEQKAKRAKGYLT